MKEYLPLINREIAKRLITYPRMIERKKKTWTPEQISEGEHLMYSIELARQKQYLTSLRDFILCIGALSMPYRVDIFRELQRELRMRKQYYPRWVKWGRMKEETALEETVQWEQMTHDFHEKYCPDTPWRKPPTKK